MRIASKYLMILLLVSCNPKETFAPIQVNVSGALREIMHQGKLAATIGLDTLDMQNMYGLGALDSLKGEVMVLNGVPFKSAVVDSTVTMIQSSSGASLFVYSQVKMWDTLSVDSFDDISELVRSKIEERNQTEPTPFILLGSPAQINYHVINFDPEVSDISNHKEGAFNGAFTNEPVILLGFYATNAKGQYTHHDSNVHMHVIDEAKTMMGHVDDLLPGTGNFKLLLPRS